MKSLIVMLLFSLFLMLSVGCSLADTQPVLINVEAALAALPETAPEPGPEIVDEVAPNQAVRVRRITDSNCCTDAYWASNTEIRFIDQHPKTGVTGIWAIDLTGTALEPTFVTGQLGVTSEDGRYFAYPDRESGLAVIEDRETNRVWRLNLNQSPVNFTPDSKRILWIEIDRDQPFETREPVYWISDVGGNNAYPIISLARSSALAWLDNDSLLVSMLADDPDTSQFAIRQVTIAKLSIIDGTISPFFQAERPRGIALNPSHTALVYITTLAQDPADNGIWYVDLTAENPTPRSLPFLGSYRWQNDTTLIYIPFDPEATRHHFYSYDVIEGRSRKLTDDSLFPLTVANNDWSVSPAGDKILLLSAQGFSLKGLWVIELAP